MSLVPITKLPPPTIQSTLTVKPAEPALSVQKVKDHCHIYGNDEDGWVGDIIDAMTSAVEDWAQIALVQQTWAQVFDGVPDDTFLEFCRRPVVSVSSFNYYAADGTEAPVPTASYATDLTVRWPRIYLKEGCAWPSSTRPKRSMVLTFVAGFGTNADAVPSKVTLAMLKAIARQYMNREAGAELLTLELKLLLAKYRKDWL